MGMKLRTRTVVTLACMCLLAACGNSAPSSAESSNAGSGRQRDGDPDTLVFPYSVVPGGTRTPEQVRRAVASDAVVAGHYQAVRLGELKPKLLEQPMRGYVSYRRGDSVFWTSQPLILRTGEVILSDGESIIRGRCGNLVSDTPRSPVEPPRQQPSQAELDLPVPVHALGAELPPVTAPDEIATPDPMRVGPEHTEAALSNLPDPAYTAAADGPRGGILPMPPAVMTGGGAAATGKEGGSPTGPPGVPPVTPPGPIVVRELLPSPQPTAPSPLPGTPAPMPTPPFLLSPPAGSHPPPLWPSLHPPPGGPPYGSPPPWTPPAFHPPPSNPPPPGPPAFPPPGTPPPPQGPPPSNPPPRDPPPGDPPPWHPPHDPPSAMPEPSAWLTLGAGLLAIGFYVEKRKK